MHIFDSNQAMLPHVVHARVGSTHESPFATRQYGADAQNMTRSSPCLPTHCYTLPNKRAVQCQLARAQAVIVSGPCSRACVGYRSTLTIMTALTAPLAPSAPGSRFIADSRRYGGSSAAGQRHGPHQICMD